MSFGFKHIFIIASNKAECSMYTLPTEEEVARARIDFLSYTSPDEERPMLGILAATAIKQVCHLMFDHVQRRENVLAIAPTKEIMPKRMRTFTYVQNTDELIVHSHETASDQPSSSTSQPSSSKSAKPGAGGGVGKGASEPHPEPLKTPKLKKPKVADNDTDEEDPPEPEGRKAKKLKAEQGES